jgi:hypothetical protein
MKIEMDIDLEHIWTIDEAYIKKQFEMMAVKIIRNQSYMEFINNKDGTYKAVLKIDTEEKTSDEKNFVTYEGVRFPKVEH